MSSWAIRQKYSRPVKIPNDPFTTPYDRVPYIKIIDKTDLYGNRHMETRMFNCSIVVRDICGAWSFHLKDESDTLYFIYRQTPLNTVRNSIFMTTLDLKTYKMMMLPTLPIVRNQEKGDKEDARFFIFNSKLGLSYTDKYTMGLGFLDESFKLSEVDLPFKNISPVEKNWTFFEHKGELLGIRFYQPLIIYKVDQDETSISPSVCWGWHMPNLFNDIRGGAPPVLLGDRYYVFTHTAHTYHIQVLTLDSETLEPLEFTPSFLFPDVNTKFQFICGAVFDEMKYEWILSVGIDDMFCGIMKIHHTRLLKLLKDINLKKITMIDTQNIDISTLRTITKNLTEN